VHQRDGLERLTDVRRVLIVEDDRELRTMLERLLGDEGYHVDAVADGQAGLHRALIDRYDVMVIDRGLPAIDGLALTRRLRDRGVATPVIILTAYGSVVDRVEGLDAGAEDYLVKPFEVDELLARLRALLRRHATVGETIQIGNGSIDLVRRIARTSDGRAIELSGRECALLRTLASRPGRVFNRDELRTTVFDTADSETVVDTYVHYLRRKLGKGVVHTKRGHGYRIGVM
jgi:two-component system, OmpR family, response regulator QseB